MAEDRGLMESSRPGSPNQLFLLPPSLLEWLPQDHIVHVLSALVDQLDLSPVTADPPALPHAADPRMMVKLLFYAYVSGIASSRRIARRCVEDVGFRVLTWNAPPSFRSIGAFRHQFRPALQSLFLQIVRCCRQLGLNRVGDIALNGTTGAAKASARRSGRSVWSQSVYTQLVTDIEAFFTTAEEADAAEDRQLGVATLGEGLPAALVREDNRQAAIREALAYLSAEGAVHEVDSPVAPAQSKRWSASSPMLPTEMMAPEQPETAGSGGLAPKSIGPPGPDLRKRIRDPKSAGVAIPMSEIAHLLEEALDPVEAPAYGAEAAEDSGESSDPPAVELQSQEEVAFEPPGARPGPDVSGIPSRAFDLSYVTGTLRIQASQTVRGRIVPTPSGQENRRRNARVRMPDRYPAKLQLQDVVLIDLSRSGALVEHIGSVRPGQLYQLSFGLDGEPVNTQARAVRGQANRLAPPENGERRIVYRTALEFVRIDSGGSERILTHIQRMLNGAPAGT